MYQRLKARTHEILKIPSSPGDRAGRAFDAFIVALILLTAFVVVVETLPGVAERYGSALLAFETFSLAVFCVEYVLRVWSATADPAYAHPLKGRLRFALTPFALVDLVAILPAVFLVGVDLRLVRVLRLTRLLKLTRYSRAAQVLGNVLRRSREELAMSFAVVLMALVLTASLMYYAERDAQPDKFTSIPATMWWAVVTLTTVGYGDLVPVTPVGKLIGAGTVLLGILTLALPVGILSSSFVDELRGAKRCPHCGKALHARQDAEEEPEPDAMVLQHARR